MGGRGRRASLCHQRAELRSLQNLRHQGSESKYHLGAAGRRRRTELSEYVRTVLAPELLRIRSHAVAKGPVFLRNLHQIDQHVLWPDSRMLEQQSRDAAVECSL